MRRGAALVELAVVLTLLIPLALFSGFLTEVARTRLQIRQAARFVAWELTSYVLADYAGAAHGRAFAHARAEVLSDARRRFSQEGEQAASPQLAVHHAGFAADVVEHPLPVSPVLGRWLGSWGFDLKGQVDASAQVHLTSILPWGERFEEHQSLIATGWDLPDGADALIRSGRAGSHRAGADPSGLYLQVQRMRLLGQGERLSRLPLLARLARALPGGLPVVTGTFVVSQNYDGRMARGCNHPAHPSPGGLSNLDPDPGVDFPELRCFDSAPFRDVARYDGALNVQAFRQRGPFFLGCVYPQAEDPASDAAQGGTPCGP